MSDTYIFTGNLQKDWAALVDIWKKFNHVLQSEVGPTWETPEQHLVCINFAKSYPESKQFLIEKLSAPDPNIAAYAFKCLIRVADITKEEIPGGILNRQEPISLQYHSFVKIKELGQFMTDYFSAYSSQEELLHEQQQTQNWQDNELADYKKSMKNQEGR